jgi:uncharacterized protein YbjT (DUF2867 family)
MSRRILILGGTGLLGRHAANNLQQEGFSVRILARNLQKAQGMYDDSFEIVQGNANNSDDVRKALEGCYGAHISLSEIGDLAGTRNVVEAAKETGLAHITYVSGATVHEAHGWFPLVADKLQAEAAVLGAGVPYTIFCPTWFFEMTFNFIERAVIFGKHSRPYHWLAADDFGRMVAVAYQKEVAYNKRFCIMGPEALLMEDVLKRICARLYPHVTSFRHVPLWMAKLIARATGNSRMLAGSQLMGYFAKIGVEAVGDPTEANAILGAPSTTLDQWLTMQEANREEIA